MDGSFYQQGYSGIVVESKTQAQRVESGGNLSNGQKQYKQLQELTINWQFNFPGALSIVLEEFVEAA